MRAFLRTQQAVIHAYLRDALVTAPRPMDVTAPTPAAVPTAIRAPRCVPVVEPAPYVHDEARPWPTGVLIVTDDGRETAQTLQAALNDTATRVAVLDHATLNSRHDIRTAIEAACIDGLPLVGILHLAPMSDAPAFPNLSASEWGERLDREIRAALLLLQAASPELAASRDGAFFFAAFSRGADAFEPGPVKGGPHPWRGGLAGLLRCAAKEWPGARICTIDVDDVNAARLVEIVPREWNETCPVEIGLRGEARLTIEPRRADWAEDEPDVSLNSDSTVLVTGGARGITAECVHDLAQLTRARFILLGRSAAPAGDESSATRDIDDPTQLRRAVVGLKQEAGEKPTPKAVESEVNRLLREREIRATLSGIRDTGATVEYVPCDVRDAAAFEALLKETRARHGRIDAVIHGAGVIEDKLIVDKTPESFARVIGTKLDPLLTLTHVLDWNEVRFCMLFASIAGTFGNPGQADYGAANEIMNRLASSLQSLCSGHVVAVNWGPWGGGGMVTEDVARQFAERGVGLVPPEGGRRIVRQELLFGKRDARIIVGDGIWISDANRRAIRDGMARSLLLHTARLDAYDDAQFRVTVLIGADSHPMLIDHSMDGKPVLPLMFALELMAEAVAQVSFGRRVIAVRDLRLFQGIVVEDAVREIAVRAERRSDSALSPVSPVDPVRKETPVPPGSTEEVWTVALHDPGKQGRPFYSATVVTGERFQDLSQSRGARGEKNTLSANSAPLRETFCTPNGVFPKSVKDGYGDWLFHGPGFQRIAAIPRFGRPGADAVVEPAYDETNADGPSLCFDPILLDTIPQLATLWSRACFDSFPLPNRIASFRALAPIGDAPVDLRLRLDPASDETTYKADAWIERDGRVLWEILGLEGTGSKALNRLSRK